MVSTGVTPNSRAVVQGLKGHPELNNRLVQCIHLDSETGRWKSKLLGDTAADETDFIAVEPDNLKPVPPSAFIMKIAPRSAGEKELEVPCVCSIGLDGYGARGVRIMYSDFLGLPALVPVYRRFYIDDPETPPPDDELLGLTGQMFGIVTSPYDGRLKEDECIVVRSKHKDLYEALVAYACLRDTEKTAVVGMHTDVRVCRILFPYVTE